MYRVVCTDINLRIITILIAYIIFSLLNGKPCLQKELRKTQCPWWHMLQKFQLQSPPEGIPSCVIFAKFLKLSQLSCFKVVIIVVVIMLEGLTYSRAPTDSLCIVTITSHLLSSSIKRITKTQIKITQRLISLSKVIQLASNVTNTNLA